MKKNSMPWIISIILLVVIVGGGFWYFKTKHASSVTDNYILGEVTRGQISKRINATGTIQGPTKYNLSFNVKAKITQINVSVGDSVTTGQALAQLDTTVANQQILQAKISLANSQAKLAQVKSGPSQIEILSAQNTLLKDQANLVNAQKVLEAVKNAPDLEAAKNIDQSLNIYSSLEDAIKKEQIAVDMAQAQVTLDQANLTAKQAGPSSIDLQSAQASVDQANSNLAIAQAALNDYQLVAPADGIITTVTGEVGEYPGTTSGGAGGSSSSAFIVLEAASPNVTINVPADEADIGSVKVDQIVEITLPAYPGKKFSGTVTQVSTTGQSQSGVTTFPVTITAPNPDGLMFAGMSANVSVIMAEKANVLIVPSEAVRGSNSNRSVLLPPAQGTTATQTKQVQIGLDDGVNAEVVGGLQQGDQVIVGVRAAATSTTNRNSTSSPFGGMGGAVLRGTGGGGGVSGGNFRGGAGGN